MRCSGEQLVKAAVEFGFKGNIKVMVSRQTAVVPSNFQRVFHNAEQGFFLLFHILYIMRNPFTLIELLVEKALLGVVKNALEITRDNGGLPGRA